MYKIVNLAGRISLFFVIEVAMYYAMIVAAIIDATILPVFNYDKGTDAHVK